MKAKYGAPSGSWSWGPPDSGSWDDPYNMDSSSLSYHRNLPSNTMSVGEVVVEATRIVNLSPHIGWDLGHLVMHLGHPNLLPDLFGNNRV